MNQCRNHGRWKSHHMQERQFFPTHHSPLTPRTTRPLSHDITASWGARHTPGQAPRLHAHPCSSMPAGAPTHWLAPCWSQSPPHQRLPGLPAPTCPPSRAPSMAPSKPSGSVRCEVGHRPAAQRPRCARDQNAGEASTSGLRRGQHTDSPPPGHPGFDAHRRRPHSASYCMSSTDVRLDFT